MNKRRIIALVILVLIAGVIGVFALRALPSNDVEQPPAQEANPTSQTKNDTTNPSTTNNPSTKAVQPKDEQSPVLTATGPEDSLTVFIVATILGVAAFNVWRIVGPRYLNKHSYK